VARGRALLTGASLAWAGALLSGCPFQFEEEASENTAPNTYFEFAPPDTTFRNEVSYGWVGTDLDSDVVAYQFQLVQTDELYYFSTGAEGNVLLSISPHLVPGPLEEEDRKFIRWGERQTENFKSFSDLEDGWYEFRARAIDEQGVVDGSPAATRCYVFFDDVAPVPIIVSGGGRLEGRTFTTFCVDAYDLSRSSSTPRELLQYSAQLRATSSTLCTQHLSDPFAADNDRQDGVEDGWGFFPPESEGPLCIGEEPPFLYIDLFPPGCKWTFTLRVKDPAGLISSTTKDVEAT
jgi:hypothetical protein